MIARIWQATARPDRIDAYVSYLRDKTFPLVQSLDGHRGACVLRRDAGGMVAVTVITLWESLEAIGRFSGADVEAAVVPAEAQALLERWDERAVHWHVAHTAVDKSAAGER